MLNRLLGASLLAGCVAVAGCASNVDKDCNVTGHACTWLGIAGQLGVNGDGHTRGDTEIYWSMDMVFAADHTTWFIDWNNHLVRRVNADGTVQSMVGWTHPLGFPGDGDPNDPTLETSASGAPGTDIQLNHPTGLLQLADGTILIMAWHDHKIREVNPATGMVHLVGGAGPGFAGDGGPVINALFNRPSSITSDEQGNLYLVDQVNERIRRIDATTQVITTVAGNGKLGYAGDGGAALQAELNFQSGDNPEPSGGVAYANGKLYVADTENSVIRVVDVASGTINLFAGAAPVAVCGSLPCAHLPSGDATMIAPLGTATQTPSFLSPQSGFSGDGGPALSALLYHPRGLAIGPEGDLYFADTENGAIRAINLTTDVIRTVAGTGTLGMSPRDDQLATQTELDRVFQVNFDPEGNMYISDTINSRYVRVAR